MTQQRCERGADWVVRSLERESIDFPWEESATLYVSIPMRAATRRPFMLMHRQIDRSTLLSPPFLVMPSVLLIRVVSERE